MKNIFRSIPLNQCIKKYATNPRCDFSAFWEKSCFRPKYTERNLCARKRYLHNNENNRKQINMDSNTEHELAKTKLGEIKAFLEALPVKLADSATKLTELQAKVDTNDADKAALQVVIDRLVAQGDELESLVNATDDAKDAVEAAP